MEPASNSHETMQKEGESMVEQLVFECPSCSERLVQAILYRRSVYPSGSPKPLRIQIHHCPCCQYMYNSQMTKSQYEKMNEAYLQYSPSTFEATIDIHSGMYQQGLLQKNFIEAHYPFSHHTNRLLDVGCGEGIFLAIMQDSGYLCDGIEPSSGQASIAQCRTNGTVFQTYFENLNPSDDQQYDRIAFRHVLEHVMHPKDILARIPAFLKPDGVVYIEIPDALKPKVMIPPYFVPEHISYFTLQNLNFLIEQAGMKIIHWESFENNPTGSMNYPVLRILAQVRQDQRGLVQPKDASVDIPAVYQTFFQHRFRLLQQLHQRLRDVHAEQGFWVYGAGYHSEILFEELPEWLHYVHGFIDNQPSKQGIIFLGKPVFAPVKLQECSALRILFSSIHENEMEHSLHHYKLPKDLQTIKLYTGEFSF